MFASSGWWHDPSDLKCWLDPGMRLVKCRRNFRQAVQEDGEPVTVCCFLLMDGLPSEVSMPTCEECTVALA